MTTSTDVVADHRAAGLASDRYPVQVVWGTRDPPLKVDIHGEAARRAAGIDTIHRLPGKHFLQEDQAPAIADLVAGITRG
ncbi:MAG: hypothetical protein ACR2ND_02220 [Solirubrobacteraceae bacterium]